MSALIGSVLGRACRSAPSPRLFVRHVSTTGSKAGTASAPAARRRGVTALAGVAVATGAYSLGSAYPPDIATLLYPRQALAPHSRDSPEGIAYATALEREMLALPYLQKLREDDTNHEWYETRPFKGVDTSAPAIQNNLTMGALRGPGHLAVPPLVRARKDESAGIAIVHVGRGLCGHDGIAHGGLLATLVDEASARTALLNLSTHIGVTARLEMDYVNPVRADRFVVIRTELVERKGRKVVVKATIEDLEGTVFVRSRSIFVEPKYAKLLSSGDVLKALGVPPAEPPVGSVQ
ncbi:Thioesterase/thiol ester dehydrase-isomerase [Auriculariales sp. MPI-PUGE-AT-0066]|nr:Thioesterase/thiol ester dehydrase-isomerase [Auriculariales sp. MPI-PUGE-AT-0066]